MKMPRASALLLGFASVVWAQTAQIAGSISDPFGGAVPATAVTATNTQTGIRRTSVSNEQGNYGIPVLPPGTYDVVVRKEGFKAVSRGGIRLQVNDSVTLNFQLEVGAQIQTITVEADPPLLRTADAEVGTVITSLMIANLPQLDRNPLNLLRLAGNVSGAGRVTNSSTASTDTRINGGRSYGIEFQLDGGSIMTGKSHSVGLTAIPDMETVGEFKVIANGMSAQYGRASGGLVEVATKGGANRLHGQLFEYFHNQLLNANSWEQNWSSPYVPGKKADRAVFHQNDYGGVASGPVVRNRTFFLFDLEQFKKRTGAVNQLGSAPTAAEREGDLSGLLYAGVGAQMYDPLGNIVKDENGNFIKTTPMGGDGKHIPASRIDPLARRVLAYMALPNHTATPGYSQYNGYLGQTRQMQDRTSWTVRLDHNFTEEHHFSFRFNRMNYGNVQTEWFNDLRPDKADYANQSVSTSFGWDWTISPTSMLSVRTSVVHNPDQNGPNYSFDMRGWELDPVMLAMENYLPNVSFRTWSADPGWGGQNFLGGDQTFPAASPDTNYTFAASVSKIYGRHTIKTGVEHRRFYSNHFEHLSGTINYYGAAVAQENYGDPFWSSASSRANGFGSFLLGIPDSADNQYSMNAANSTRYYAAFVQDDFKAASRLTLNLGLRWDMDTPLSERSDRLFGWDPDAASPYTIPEGWSWSDALSGAGLGAAEIASLPVPQWARSGKLPKGAGFFVGTPGYEGRLAAAYHPWHFAPRLGAAYSLTPHTVLRASWGMSYITVTGNYWAAWVAGSDSAASTVFDRSAVNGNLEHSNMSLFYPQEYVKYAATNAALNQNLLTYAGSNSLWNKDADMPREYNFGVSIQHQIGSVLLEAGWAGNHSGNLLATQSSTQFPASLLSTKYTKLFATMVDNPLYGQVQDTSTYTHQQVPLGALMLSNPAFGGFSISGLNIGRSNYNAFNVKVEKRLSMGVAFLLNYSLSKSLDNVGNLTGDQGEKTAQSYQSVADLYGVSPLDETHRLSFYHDVQLPFGKGRRFLGDPDSLAGRIVDRVVGGWELAGTATLRSGRPVSFVPLQGDMFHSSGIQTLWGQMTGDPNSLYFTDNGQVLTSGLTDPSAQVRRFDASHFMTSAQAGMIASNIPAIAPWTRNPGAASYDASLMKNFRLRGEAMNVQLRVEAQNLFNIRGFGTYDSNYDSPTFGLITSSAQNPRNMQISARLTF
jgi:hypothetical protein